MLLNLRDGDPILWTLLQHFRKQVLSCRRNYCGYFELCILYILEKFTYLVRVKGRHSEQELI